jgi:hypothetical protein
MNRIIKLVTSTKAERLSTIDSINESISQCGGWVDDVHFYSNIAVALRCFIPAERSADFSLGLIELGLVFDVKAIIEELNLMRPALPAKEDILFSINITFFHDEPDLRRHIPSVPGY